jgi:hypothetical protein
VKILPALLSFTLALAPLCLAESGSLALAANHPAPAAPKAASAGSAQATDSEAKPEISLTSGELASAYERYKNDPSELSWQDYVKTLRGFLSSPTIARQDPASVIKHNPSLTELQVKVIQATPCRIWTFPKLSSQQATLIQSTFIKTTVVPFGRRRKKTISLPVSRLDLLTIPAGVAVKDGRSIDVPCATDKAGKTERARFLVLTGTKRGGNGMYLASYKQTADGWHENNEPLSAIPPYLLSNISGLIGFNGSDLVVTVTPQSPQVSSSTGAEAPEPKLPEPQSANYKLALRLVGGKFALEGSPVEDTPYNAVFQLVRALTQGHVDLAKAWLTDPNLVSIPKYIGLSTKNPQTPPRIINMSGPQSGYRYRLVTFDRYDLIFEVTKLKLQWAVKAIFVAPADALLQKIARSLQTQEKTGGEERSTAASSEPDKLPVAGQKTSN